MEKIDLSWRITTFEGYNFESREQPKVVDADNLGGLLESVAGDEPLIIIALGTRKGNQDQGEWPVCMGETKKILCYASRAFKQVEAERLDREQREQCKRVMTEKKARRKMTIQGEVERMKSVYDADKQADVQKDKQYQNENLEIIAEERLIAAGMLEPEPVEQGIESENEKVVVHE